MRQRILTLILMVSIVISMATIPVSVSAATNGDCGESLKWLLDDNGTLTISGEGEMHDFDSTYDFDTMKTSTSTPWYNESGLIKAVIIEEGVTRIGNNAFRNCDNLIDVTFPNSLLEIGKGAFMFTNLSKVILPDSLKKIDNNLFTYCTNLNEIQLGKHVEYIGRESFSSCRSLNSITIPKSVNYIGDCAFSGSNLNTVYYEGLKKQWDSINKSNVWNYGINNVENLVINYIVNGTIKDYASYDPNSINILIDGNYIKFDVQPQIINGRTLVPMRRIFEELGATVDWDDSTKTAIGTKENTIVKFTINDYTMYKNESAKALDVPAQLINGRTLIPLRAVSEAFDCQVGWDGNDSIVSIIDDSENYTMLYALNDRSKSFPSNTVNAQLTVGWYIDPLCEMDTQKVNDDKETNIIHEHVPPVKNTADTSSEEFLGYGDEIDTSVTTENSIDENNKSENDGLKLETIDDIESYLNTQYSMIKIGGEIHPIQYSVMLNIMDSFQWDVNITPKIGTNNEILMPLRMNFTTYNNKDKQEIVDSIRAFMEPLAKDIIAHFPKHKIICYFDEGYYKYPNVRVDYVVQNYFTWANYEYKLLGKNKTTKPEDFRWVYEHDTGGRLDFNDYFSDIEINTPATIEDHFDNFVIRSLEYKGNTSLNYEGTEVNVTYEATANGSGFAYLNFYDKNGKLLGSEIEHFYSGTDEHMGSWPIGTAKITLSGDADINYERKDEDNFTSNVPFEIPAEYSFEEDFEIIDCYFVDCGVSLLDDCCSYTFIIEANGSDSVYVNFFDEDGYYLDSSYKNIWDGKNEYIFFDMPEGATHIEFSKKKTTKINN